MSRKGIGVKSAADLKVWFVTSISQIVGWINDGTRTLEELKPLKEAIQAVIEHKSFRVVFTEPSKSLKDLATSIDPAEIHSAWVQLYAKWGIQYPVPEVPFTVERVKAEKKRDRILIYLAPELSMGRVIPELGELFPKMQACMELRKAALEGIVSDDEVSGWLFVEKALNTPNLGTTEEELREVFRQQNVKGMTLNAYIIFGQFCKDIWGEYPDVFNWRAKLLGSSCENRVMVGNFSTNGFLDINRTCFWASNLRFSNVGGRSVAQ